MTPKEKAKELILKYYELVKNKYPSTSGMPLAKECALIAVNEIINHCAQVEPFLGVDYWKEVKNEIKKL